MGGVFPKILRWGFIILEKIKRGDTLSCFIEFKFFFFFFFLKIYEFLCSSIVVVSMIIRRSFSGFLVSQNFQGFFW